VDSWCEGVNEPPGSIKGRELRYISLVWTRVNWFRIEIRWQLVWRW